MEARKSYNVKLRLLHSFLILSFIFPLMAQVKRMDYPVDIHESRYVLVGTSDPYHEQLPAVYFRSGIEKDQLQDFDGAIFDFSKAVELKSDYAEAYDYRGMMYLKTYKFNKAIKDFNKALQLIPGSAEILNHLGVAHYCIQRYDLALRDYSRAIDADNNFSKAYYNRGLLLYEMEDFEAAYSDLLKARLLNHPDASKFIEEMFPVSKQ